MSAYLPRLTGRTAVCRCGRTMPSEEASVSGFGFEYRGEGSKLAELVCTCGFFREGHDRGGAVLTCAAFQARGPGERDTYYCGCQGWGR